MRRLDETDMEILTLLGENARRPFSDIGEVVGLSGPAVSNRVNRLQEAGIINRFTIDVDRSQLHAGIPVFVQVTEIDDKADELQDRIRDEDAVEYIFVTVDSGVWFYGRAHVQNVRQWLDGLLGEDVDYSVTLMDEVEWRPSLDGTEFALTCAECSNTVDNEGQSTRLDGQVYHFCCPLCQSRFEDRYDRLEEGA